MGFPSFTKKFHHEPYPAIDPTQPELSAEGRIVLVTGAGSGIGQATAVAFARAKAKVVVLAGRRISTLEATKKKIEAVAGSTAVVTHPLDVSSQENVKAVFDAVAKDHGPIDVCVHGAGHLSEPGKLHESTLSNFWDSFEVNVKGSFLINQAFLSQPAPEGRERVLIFMNSLIAHLNAKTSKTAPASYACSKLAQAKLMEYIASENDDRKGFRTYACQPGIVETEMSNRSVDMSPPGTREAMEWDSPDLSAHFFVWLASPKGACIPSGRYLWAHWDVEELKQRRKELYDDPVALTLTLSGWPFPLPEVENK